jgi:hypothetical protein
MYILNGTEIKSPNTFNESNSTLVAQNRTLDGSISRDYFGTNKRVWVFEYRNTKGADYQTIKTIYDAYLNTAVAVTFESTEGNYTIAQTNVHVDLKERSFRVHGEDYISDFTLVLTEA